MAKNNSTSRAEKAQVKIGHIEIEGLMLPDGSFSIGFPQIASLLSIPPQHAARDFKALLGIEKPVPKVQTELHSNPVHILTIPEFEQLLKVLAVNGNEQAQVMLGIPQKTKTSSRRLERNIQLSLQASIGGIIEVKTVAGNIDLLTSDQIIEVKDVKAWKSALGQIIVYGKYYPSHQKRIHLFGETQTSYLELIRSHCSPLNVIVTHKT